MHRGATGRKRRREGDRTRSTDRRSENRGDIVARAECLQPARVDGCQRVLGSERYGCVIWKERQGAAARARRLAAAIAIVLQSTVVPFFRSGKRTVFFAVGRGIAGSFRGGSRMRDSLHRHVRGRPRIDRAAHAEDEDQKQSQQVIGARHAEGIRLPPVLGASNNMCKKRMSTFCEYWRQSGQHALDMVLRTRHIGAFDRAAMSAFPFSGRETDRQDWRFYAARRASHIDAASACAQSACPVLDTGRMTNGNDSLAEFATGGYVMPSSIATRPLLPRGKGTTPPEGAGCREGLFTFLGLR